MTDPTLGRVFPTLDFAGLPRKGMRHLHSLLRRARDARDYRRLARLPDRLLDDIGVTRERAEDLARRGGRGLPDRADVVAPREGGPLAATVARAEAAR